MRSLDSWAYSISLTLTTFSSAGVDIGKGDTSKPTVFSRHETRFVLGISYFQLCRLSSLLHSVFASSLSSHVYTNA